MVYFCDDCTVLENPRKLLFGHCEVLELGIFILGKSCRTF